MKFCEMLLSQRLLQNISKNLKHIYSIISFPATLRESTASSVKLLVVNNERLLNH